MEATRSATWAVYFAIAGVASIPIALLSSWVIPPALLFPIAAPLGVILGFRARRRLRAEHWRTATATTAIGIGTVGTVLWLLSIQFFIAEVRRFNANTLPLDEQVRIILDEKTAAEELALLGRDLYAVIPDPPLRRHRDVLLADLRVSVADGCVGPGALSEAKSLTTDALDDGVIDREESERVFAAMERALDCRETAGPGGEFSQEK